MFTQECHVLDEVKVLVARGASWEEKYLWEADGVPVNLTGATTSMTWRYSQSSAAVIQFTQANGRIVLDGPNGLITARLQEADTVNLTRPLIGDLVIDFPATAEFPTGRRVVLLRLEITVYQTVTA